MGKLKITTDGRESLTFKDKSDIVLGNNDRLTAGNDAYVSAGLKEEIVVGMLLNLLLGGSMQLATSNLEFSLLKMTGATSVVNFFGQNEDIGELANKVTATEQSVAEMNTEISNLLVKMAVNDIAVFNVRSIVGDTNVASLQGQICQIAEHAATIATSVSTVAGELKTIQDSTTLLDVETKMGTTSTQLTEMTQIV